MSSRAHGLLGLARRAKARASALMLLWFAACDAEQGDGAGDGGVQQADAAAFVGCPNDIPPFSLGMSATSADGSLKAVLRVASHVPPVRFLNDWTVEFTDAQGNPLPMVDLRSARTFMPVHGHYGAPDAKVMRHADAPSLFDLDALNLFMRGPWEVQLAATAPNAGDTALVFEVCVEE